jgi:WD40 repeat protein
MPAFPVRLLVLIGLALAARSSDAAEPQLRTDQNGDPLPPGALVRFGSSRWRVNGTPYAMRYNAEGKSLLVFSEASDRSQIGSLLSAAEGKRLRHLDLGPSENLPMLGGRIYHYPSSFASGACAVSPDGQWLARIRGGHHLTAPTIDVYKVASGQPLLEIHDKKCWFSYVLFTPDSKHLAAIERQDSEDDPSGEGTQSIRLWDVASGKAVRRFEPPAPEKDQVGFRPDMISFSPDGSLVAALGNEADKIGVIRLWDMAGKRGSWRLQGEIQRNCTAFVFSPDGKMLASANSADELCLWDTTTGRTLRRLSGKIESLEALVFSPDGSRLVSGHGKVPTLLWDLTTGQKVVEFRSETRSVVFSPDGQTLALADAGRHVRLIEARTGKELRTIEGSFLSGDVLSCTFPVATQGTGWPIAFSPDGRTLAALSTSHAIRRWSVATGKELPLPGPNLSTVQTVALSPDGKLLAAAGSGHVRFWDAVSGKYLRPLTGTPAGGPPIGDDGECIPMHLIFSSDGKRLAAAWADGSVTVWDVTVAKLLWCTAPHTESALSLAFAAGDAVLLSGGSNAQVTWWDAATGRRLRTWGSLTEEIEARRVASVALSPDARLGVWLGEQRDAPVMELATGQQRCSIPASLSFSLRFAPDGRSVAVSRGEETALIDLAGGKTVRCFNAGSGVYPPSFSPDGRRLFATCADGSLRAWETATGTCLGCLDVQAAAGADLAVTPDGRRIITCCDDSTLLLCDAIAPFTRRSPSPLGDRELRECWDTLAAEDAVRAGASLARLAAAPRTLAFLKENLRPASSARMTPAEELRAVRTVELLEDIGGTEASALLETLACGVAGARLTEEAQASLRRREPPPRTEPLRRLRDDPREEPLPHGARARLGSLRFQHDEPVASLRYLPDGKTLLTVTHGLFLGCGVGRQRSSRLTHWDTESGRQRSWLRTMLGEVERKSEMNGDTVPAPDGCLSPDGRLVAEFRKLPHAQSDTFAVKELATGEPLFQVQDETDPFTFVCFAPDSKTLAAVGAKSFAVRLFSPADGKEVGRLLPPTAGPNAAPSLVIFSPDGRYAAAQVNRAPAGAAVWLWKVADGAIGERLPGSSLRMSPIAFSPDSKALAVVCAGVKDKPVLRLWDPAIARPLCDLSEYGEAAESLLFSPDGRFLVVQTGRRARLWDVAQRTELPAIERVTAIDLLLFSPDSKTLVVGEGTTLSLVDPTTGQSRRELTYDPCDRHRPDGLAEMSFYEAEQGLGRAAAFSPDSKVLAAADGNSIRRWLVATGAPIDPPVNPTTIRGLVASADGRRVVVAGEGRVVVWDGATGRPLRLLPIEPTTNDPQPVARCVALTPDGKHVAAGTGQERLFLWEDGSTAHEIPAHTGAVDSLCFTSDGRWLISAGADHCVVWWDVATGQEVRRVRLARPGQNSRDANDVDDGPLILSPDGRLVVTGGDSLHVWELASGRVRLTIPNAGGWLPLIVSPDGRRLVVSARWGLRMYDLRTGEEVRFFSVFGRIDSVAFSPDGKLLVAGGVQDFRLWDVATATVLAEREGHRCDGVGAVAFSADGRTLATGGSDTTVLLWDVAALVKQAITLEPRAAELADLWEALAADDATRAYEAQVRLTQHPNRATALLSERLKPATAPTAARLSRLVADLEAEEFEVRQRALHELRDLGELAEPALRKALAGKPSSELRRQIELLLDRLSAPVAEPAQARELRAVELLETVGTTEAQAVLQNLARGVPEVELTRQAQAALRRLAVRTSHR